AFGLATIGIFGVVAYTVAQRTHEIGVRMALGEQKGNVFRLIVGRGIFLATVGTAMGFIGAVFVVLILSSAAYSDSWFSALLILVIAPASVILAALFASYIPARRAMRVDPMVALRYECGSMTLWSRFRFCLRAIMGRTRVESEMDAELRFHIEAFAEDLVRNGVPREEEWRRARIEFGGIERAIEEFR